MTIRKEISIIENLYHDSQRVDQKDMEVEQSKNDQLVSAVISNHFGSGILLLSPTQKVLFDSDNLTATQAGLLPNLFDGTGMPSTEQPTDINLGNQLEVELTESSVIGRFSVRVAIIGLDFNGNIQMDRMYFHKNGKQVTSKHYKEILALFFNDFKGNNNYSRNHGGRIVIRESESFQISLDPIMTSQDVEPDIFWRDFKTCLTGTSGPKSLTDTIQEGIGLNYSIDGLNINVTGRVNQSLPPNDVVYQVGQKFKALTNNIQKITLLLGTELDTSQPEISQFDWAGDLVISIYSLQTTVSCQSSLMPSLSIDFDPSNTPLAQLSYSQATLKSYGYVLTDVLQPVDFVFNSTQLGGSIIEPDKYYAITARRSGAAISGTLFLGVGGDRLADSRATIYNGTWVDVTDEDLWFQVWTDAAKLTDGQAYDAGIGVSINKTIVDSETGSTIDNQSGHYSFVSTGENTLNTAIVQAVELDSDIAQDERTGNPIFTRKQYVPSLSFVSDASLASIKSVSEPLVVGCAKDTNPKINPTLDKELTLPGLVGTDTFCIINPDADLLSLNLIGSVLLPNVLNTTSSYRIVKAVLCTDGYGDVNGDGVIDLLDIQRASEMAADGYDLSLAATQTAIANGTLSVLEMLRGNIKNVSTSSSVSGVDVSLITSYVNKSINSFPAGSTFTRLCLTVQNLTGRNDGYFDCGDGLVRIDGAQGVNIVDTSLLSSSALLYYGYASAPDMKAADPAFTAVPYLPINFRIVPYPVWQDYMVLLGSNTRKVPASFTSQDGTGVVPCDAPVPELCNDKNVSVLLADPGRNDIYIPDSLMIDKGQIIRPNGDYFKVDVEIGSITLELPATPLSESVINIFDKFVADRGDGLTNGSYKAMKYADCTTVQPADLALNRVRFSVSLQSFYPNLDGYEISDGYGLIVDDIVGVYLDTSTGILKLTVKDLAVDLVYKTLVSKVQVQVFLKKAGWNNAPIIVSPNEVEGLIA